MKSELNHVDHEIKMKQGKVKESKSKIKMNKALPYLVATVVEVRLCYFYFLVIRCRTSRRRSRRRC